MLLFNSYYSKKNNQQLKYLNLPNWPFSVFADLPHSAVCLLSPGVEFELCPRLKRREMPDKLAPWPRNQRTIISKVLTYFRARSLINFACFGLEKINSALLLLRATLRVACRAHSDFLLAEVFTCKDSRLGRIAPTRKAQKLSRMALIPIQKLQR